MGEPEGMQRKADHYASMNVSTEPSRIRAAGRPKQRKWFSPPLAWSCTVIVGV